MQKNPKIVLLDNNDSFTYNFVELLRQLNIDEPLVVAPNYTGEIPFADAYIFSPGPGLPQERPLMHRVIEEFGIKSGIQKPILGICLGHQSIANFFGAQLYNLGTLKHGVQIAVTHNKNPLFEHIENPFQAALYHSWAVAMEGIEKTDLEVIANAQNIIMGLQHKHYKITGLQFHPESFLTLQGKQLIKNWLTLNL